jgi:hypothetical protein
VRSAGRDFTEVEECVAPLSLDFSGFQQKEAAMRYRYLAVLSLSILLVSGCSESSSNTTVVVPEPEEDPKVQVQITGELSSVLELGQEHWLDIRILEGEDEVWDWEGYVTYYIAFDPAEVYSETQIEVKVVPGVTTFPIAIPFESLVWWEFTGKHSSSGTEFLEKGEFEVVELADQPWPFPDPPEQVIVESIFLTCKGLDVSTTGGLTDRVLNFRWFTADGIEDLWSFSLEDGDEVVFSLEEPPVFDRVWMSGTGMSPDDALIDLEEIVVLGVAGLPTLSSPMFPYRELCRGGINFLGAELEGERSTGFTRYVEVVRNPVNDEDPGDSLIVVLPPEVEEFPLVFPFSGTYETRSEDTSPIAQGAGEIMREILVSE